MKPTPAVLTFFATCLALGAAVVRAEDDDEQHERREKRRAVSAPENATSPRRVCQLQLGSDLIKTIRGVGYIIPKDW